MTALHQTLAGALPGVRPRTAAEYRATADRLQKDLDALATGGGANPNLLAAMKNLVFYFARRADALAAE